MLFDIRVYNQITLFLAFLFSVLFLLIVFRKNIVSILDPLLIHVFWISGNLSFLFCFILKFGFPPLALFFFFNFVLYIIFLKTAFVLKVSNSSSFSLEGLENRLVKIKSIYIIITALLFVSKLDFFIYAASNPSLPSWIMYRFVDLQGRNPILRILGTGAEVYFYFFSFILLFILKKWRLLTSTFILLIIIIGVFSGGRSTLLASLIAFGSFLFYFRQHFSKALITKVNLTGGGLLIASILLAMVITSNYDEDATFLDGAFQIVNRFIAVADGLEYYMNYDGQRNIESGLYPYFLSIFGVYLKSFVGLEYKNVGTQLMELVQGAELFFAQGANYTFPLQIMVFGKSLFFIYTPFLALVVGFFRKNKAKYLSFLPISYFFSFHSFTLATDMEYGFLCLISGLLVYLIFIFPILKLK